MLQIILIMLMVIGLIWMTVSIRQKFEVRTYAVWLKIVFCVYAAGYLYFTFLSRRSLPDIVFEWRPLASYVRLFSGSSTGEKSVLKGWLAEFFMSSESPIQGIILNILLYVPLGYLVPELFRKLSNKQILLISFLATFSTELTQLIFKLGWCETDDLIHNMLGAVIGLTLHRWQEKKGILSTQNQE